MERMDPDREVTMALSRQARVVALPRGENLFDKMGSNRLGRTPSKCLEAWKI